MSWRELTDIEKQQLETVYKTFKAGRDSVWEKTRQVYPNFKGSQRSVLNEFLKYKPEWQTQRRPDRPSSIAPLQISKSGYCQGDLVIMRTNADRGFTAFFHMIDGFTKKSYAAPLRGESEEQVTAALKKCLYKARKEGKKISIIQTDNGGHFQKLFTKELEDNGIKHFYSQAYRPQSNAFVERRGGDIKRQLYQIMESNNDKRWVNNLQIVVDNINNVKSTVTGFSPNEMERGDEETLESAKNRIEKTIASRYKVHQIGKPLFLGQKVRKKRIIKGDLKKPGLKGFWDQEIYTIVQRIQTANPNFLPSYRIAKQNGDILYGRYPKTSLLPIPPIQISDNISNLAVQKAKRIVDQFDDEEEEIPNVIIQQTVEAEEPEEQPQPTRQSLRQNREGFYEVDYILGKRRKNRRVEYLVRWLGYDASADTWEPKSNLREVMDLVQEYEEGAR